jgi:hypothetical protein
MSSYAAARFDVRLALAVFRVPSLETLSSGANGLTSMNSAQEAQGLAAHPSDENELVLRGTANEHRAAAMKASLPLDPKAPSCQGWRRTKHRQVSQEPNCLLAGVSSRTIAWRTLAPGAHVPFVFAIVREGRQFDVFSRLLTRRRGLQFANMQSSAATNGLLFGRF